MKTLTQLAEQFQESLQKAKEALLDLKEGNITEDEKEEARIDHLMGDDGCNGNDERIEYETL